MSAVFVVLTDDSYAPSSCEAVTSDLETAKMIAEGEGLTDSGEIALATASEWQQSDDDLWFFTTGRYGDGGMRVERHEVVT